MGYSVIIRDLEGLKRTGCMRRLGRVIGQCGALTPAPNVAEKNRIKGVSPTAVFWSPSRRKAAKRIQAC
jgi:hypothetical protein